MNGGRGTTQGGLGECGRVAKARTELGERRKLQFEISDELPSEVITIPDYSPYLCFLETDESFIKWHCP